MAKRFTTERLSDELEIFVSPEHKFGTDAFLLANFANPRHKDRACDLGTGCGIIPFIWCKRHKPNVIFAVDIQPQAIEQTMASVEQNSLQSAVIPVLADLKHLEGKIPFGSFDLVTCNPPYKAADTGIISETQSDKIARHELMCTVSDVTSAAAKLLKFGGRLCLCQRPERLCDVLEAMRRCDIEPKRLRFVQQRPETPPWLFLVEGKKGAKPFLKVDEPFYVEGEGGFSKEMLACYGKQHNLPHNNPQQG
ncbi:tRNA1(Val) (adenine(37)-N6)-methyltransferase [Acetanaerobacterium elongatum]|uniref:tRNA1(Val) A37 N6-methylase TrmN6 n=1 Tax=Acetanaerobacterium elongatum TaxID=258515 RepID=A0A1G9WLG0_9FIRM|nr:methyltransferase [Acetanaerobacterium elongatum]SDM85083.1 tRNA1(Val) A37 N6-methylase TrmN6 [Acetanaerobacterium elongatum]